MLGGMQLKLLILGSLLMLLGYLSKKHPNLIIWCAAFCLLICFGLIKFQYLHNLDDLRPWHDTKSYVEVTEIPITSPNFWDGQRPFVLPLIYKLLGINIGNFEQFNSMWRITLFQFILNFLVWIFFAFTVSLQTKHLFLKFFSTAIILLLGLGIDIGLWERMLLTESISNSLFIFIVALILLKESIEKNKRCIYNITLSILLWISIVLYIFIRDANASIVLIGGFLYLLYVLFRMKGKKQYILNFSLSLMVILCSAFSLIQVNNSNRWWEPMSHVLNNRIMVEPELTQFFINNGLDLNKVDINLLNQPKAQQMAFYQKTKTIYTKFLISHPLYVLKPFSEINSLISPSNLSYLHNPPEPTNWERRLSNIIYPKNNIIYPIGIILCILTIVINKYKFKVGDFVVAFLILSVIPLSLLIWHSDTIEIPRHAEQFLLQSRMGFWMSILFFLDALENKFWKENSKKIIPFEKI
jgi:hypothetical protein